MDLPRLRREQGRVRVDRNLTTSRYSLYLAYTLFVWFGHPLALLVRPRAPRVSVGAAVHTESGTGPVD